MTTFYKGLIGLEDLNIGYKNAFNRLNSQGAYESKTKIPLATDIIYFAKSYNTLEDAIDDIGSTKISFLYINEDKTLAASKTLPSNIFLITAGGEIDGAFTLTIGSPNQILGNAKLFGSSITVSFTNSGPIKSLWFADVPDGTDVSTELNKMIDSAGTGSDFSFLIASNSTGYGLNGPIEFPIPASSNLRLNWIFKGDGGFGKFKMLAADNAIEVNDTTVLNPTYWIQGLKFQDIILDGNSTGTNGFRVHKVAQNVEYENCYAFDFTNAGFFLIKNLEMRLNHCYAEGCKYGLYAASGSAHIIDGGAYRANTNTGIFYGGDLDPSSLSEEDGAEFVTITGRTVVESNADYGIRITIGAAFYINGLYCENIGYNNVSGNYACVKIDSTGDADPAAFLASAGVYPTRDIFFKNCFFDTIDAGGEAINIEKVSIFGFEFCRDANYRGGTIASTAVNGVLYKGVSGKVYDFTTNASSNITNSSTTVRFIENYDDFGFKYDADNHVRFPNGQYVSITRDAEDKTALQINDDVGAKLKIFSEGTIRFGSDQGMALIVEEVTVDLSVAANKFTIYTVPAVSDFMPLMIQARLDTDVTATNGDYWSIGVDAADRRIDYGVNSTAAAANKHDKNRKIRWVLEPSLTCDDLDTGAVLSLCSVDSTAEGAALSNNIGGAGEQATVMIVGLLVTSMASL